MEAAARSSGLFHELVILVSDPAILKLNLRSNVPSTLVSLVKTVVSCMLHDVREGQVYGIIEETRWIVCVAVTDLVHLVNVRSGTNHMVD
ncbi:hypothetical protein EUGRSUZ_H01419 [Eucalyptus grandis]|uniref:Uncharacterized protein n=2 Tax=Eucalyptus grandis TaxID=71139 RepID=A0ACC3JP26_EUCGR|nr:hypothetical protein EUGRSUZ_H01419 [Eucalyptus grandis]